MTSLKLIESVSKNKISDLKMIESLVNTSLKKLINIILLTFHAEISIPFCTAQRQNSSNKIYPPWLASISLNALFGSFTSIPHFLSIGTAYLNSSFVILRSLLESMESKAIQYQQYCLIQSKRYLNSALETQSSPYDFLDGNLFLAALKALIMTGFSANSQGNLMTSLIPLSAQAKLIYPLPFTSKDDQIFSLFSVCQGISLYGSLFFIYCKS